MISRRICWVIMAVCFVLMPQDVPAQQKVAICFDHTGNDSVGSRLAYKVKEGIRRSAGLRLTNKDDAKAIMHLGTIDLVDEHPGSATAFAYTLTFRSADGPEIYIAGGVGKSGTNLVNESAEELVAFIDREVDFRRPK